MVACRQLTEQYILLAIYTETNYRLEEYLSANGANYEQFIK